MQSWNLIPERSRGQLLLPLLLLFGSFCVLNASHCYVTWDDDDDDGCGDDDDFDDDDFCDDDDDFTASNHLNPRPADYRLHDYRLVSTLESGRHPVAGLLEIQNVSLYALLGPGEYTDPDLQLFSDQILVANQDLLGLPQGSGALVFREVRHFDTFFEIVYQQILPGDSGGLIAREDAELHLLFDLMGNLRQIRNATFIVTAGDGMEWETDLPRSEAENR